VSDDSEFWPFPPEIRGVRWEDLQIGDSLRAFAFVRLVVLAEKCGPDVWISGSGVTISRQAYEARTWRLEQRSVSYTFTTCSPPEHFILSLFGHQWMAARPGFRNLLESPAGFGASICDAIEALLLRESAACATNPTPAV